MKADLHIHSCLSPCSTLYMSPSNIAEKAIERKIDLIAITDHNSALNNLALKQICDQIDSIECLFGMEICTREEIHTLVYFDDIDVILDLDKWIYDRLPNVANKPEIMGYQVMVDPEENVIRQVEKSLLNAVDLTLSDLVLKIHDMKGLVIPAHIDRPSFSLTSQIGFIPQDDFDAVEMTRHAYEDYIDLGMINGYPIISGSDAHSLEQVGTNYFEFIKPIHSISNLYKYLNK